MIYQSANKSLSYGPRKANTHYYAISCAVNVENSNCSDVVTSSFIVSSLYNWGNHQTQLETAKTLKQAPMLLSRRKNAHVVSHYKQVVDIISDMPKPLLLYFA